MQRYFRGALFLFTLMWVVSCGKEDSSRTTDKNNPYRDWAKKDARTVPAAPGFLKDLDKQYPSIPRK